MDGIDVGYQPKATAPPRPDGRGRDYSLTGADSRRAIDAGLADADWYRPPIDPERLQALMARSNRRAARDTTIWLALVIATGVLAGLSLDHWWAIPAFAVYGALFGGAADPRWHECGHGTAFRTRSANDAVYIVASFMLLREPTMWRWSHVRHHSDTLIVGRDPEISFPRPTRLRTLLPNYLHLLNGPKMIWRIMRHAVGSIDDDARDFVPADELPMVVNEARAFVAILGAVVVWSIAAGTVVPLLFVGLPSFYGVWLLWFFATTQHAGLREDVLDHRLNTRTVYMNPIFRFLYLNMNYHLEHHLFPAVPYYALPALHDEIKDHLPPPTTSTLAAYREVASALRAQRHDPTWELPNRRVVMDDGVSLRGAPATITRAPVAATALAALDARTDLGSIDLLQPGQVMRIDLDNRTYALCRPTADVYWLTDGLCTHGQTHLGDGLLMGFIIECPKHNGRFDIRTGEPLRKPARIPLITHEVYLVEGRLLVDLTPSSQPAVPLSTLERSRPPE